MRRSLARLFSLALLGALLAACGPQVGVQEPVAPTAIPDDGRIVLRVATGDLGEGLRPHQEIVARFEAANPDIRVLVETVGGDYYSELLASVGSDRPFDILQIGDDAVPTFVDQGALLPLDGYVASAEYPLDMGIYLPGVLEPGRWAGRQYLLPKDFSPLAVYYNRRIFDQFGVPYPQDGWTWQEFLETARALTRDTDGDGETDIWGVQLPGSWPAGFEYWSASAGGRLVSPDGVGFVGYMDAPQNVEALQFYADLYHRHRVAPIPADPYPFGNEHHSQFSDGQAAMRIFGRWPQADLRQNERVELGVVGMPLGRRHANILLWSGFGIAASSPNQEAAWRFLRFYAGSEGAEVWKDWALPSVQTVAEAAGLYTDPVERVWIGELDFLTPRAYQALPLWTTAGEPVLRDLLARVVSDPELDITAATYAAAQEAQGRLVVQR